MSEPIRDRDSVESLMDEIWQQQLQGWRAGKLPVAEEIFDKHPSLLEQGELAVDVIFNEFVILAEDKTGKPDPMAFCKRFPQFESELKRQFKLFDVVNLTSDAVQSTVSGCLLETARANAPCDARVPHKPQLQRFEICRKIGSGATATVYEAWDCKLKNLVALKKPHAQLIRLPRVKARMMQEAQSVSRLHHPGIVPIREIFEEDGEFFLVSSLIRGTNLQDQVSAGLPSINDSVDWAIQIADALHYAHENGIVHRDVKPSNVILSDNGQPMLTDFGLATDTESDLDITQTGEIVGTPAFMSPEQANDEFEDVDCRSDVYSLGALLFYLVTGQLPFRGSLATVIQQVIQEDPPMVRSVNPSVPVEIELVVNKCLQKDKQRRYESARELSNDLQRYRRGEPIAARRAGLVERSIRFAIQRPVLTVISTLAFLLLIFSTGIIFQLGNVMEQRDHAQSVEIKNRRLLAEASVDAGKLAMQKGRLGQAAIHFENGFRQGHADSVELKLLLVECYFSVGEYRKSVEEFKKIVTDRGADESGIIDYWKFEFASAGLNDFGDPETVLAASDFSQLDDAKKQYILGLTSENSLQSLGHFKFARELDPYHHSAHRMSLLMALSLSRIDELLDDIVISRQLYPEDVDFVLIHALALSASSRADEAIELVDGIKGDLVDRAKWKKLCREIPSRASVFARNEDEMMELPLIAEFVANSALEYLPLLQDRRWRFPPKIGRLFAGLPELLQRSHSPTEEVEWLRQLAAIHPEGTLAATAANRSLEQPGLQNTVEQLEAARDLYEQAIELPSIISESRELSIMGLFSTSLALALVHGKDVELNKSKYVYAASLVDPETITDPPHLRAFSIALIQAKRWDLAATFIDAWNEAEQPFVLKADAAWHLAILLKQRKDWDQLFAFCDNFIVDHGPDIEDTKLPNWQGWESLRESAASHLRDLLGDEVEAKSDVFTGD